MKAYKITDRNGFCKSQKYEVGNTYKFEGDIELCDRGGHACKEPMDCLNYKDLYESRFFEVDVRGGK